MFKIEIRSNELLFPLNIKMCTLTFIVFHLIPIIYSAKNVQFFFFFFVILLCVGTGSTVSREFFHTELVNLKKYCDDFGF